MSAISIPLTLTRPQPDNPTVIPHPPVIPAKAGTQTPVRLSRPSITLAEAEAATQTPVNPVHPVHPCKQPKV